MIRFLKRLYGKITVLIARLRGLPTPPLAEVMQDEKIKVLLSEIKRCGFFKTIDGCFQVGELTMDAKFFRADNAPGIKLCCYRAYGSDFKVVVKDEYFWVRMDADVEPILADGYRTVKTFEMKCPTC